LHAAFALIDPRPVSPAGRKISTPIIIVGAIHPPHIANLHYRSLLLTAVQSP
jgi:hypothetical protein